MKLTTLVALSLSTLLFACSNEPTAQTESAAQVVVLQDLQKEWQLVSIDNKKIESQSSLMVDDQAKASGNLACNQFFGTIELHENKLRIEKMGNTRKMCRPEVTAIEMRVGSTLSNWSEVQINAQELTLTGDQHTLVYHVK